MASNNESKLSSSGNYTSHHIIEISSDSEDDDVLHQPHTSAFRSILQRGNNYQESGPAENDVIELTDSESTNSSDLPDVLSPLIKRPRRKITGSENQQPLSGEFLPLYVDTSDEESDKGCILVLNDPLGSGRPIPRINNATRTFSPSSTTECLTEVPLIGVDQQVEKGSPVRDSSRDAIPGFFYPAQKLPNERLTQKARDQILREKYAAELFAELNKNIFGDRLPKNTILQWSKRLLTTAGRARWHRSREGVNTTKIELASKILDCDERIRNTLSHEMCHLACWVIDNHPREGHGRLFKSWANKVMYKYPNIHISTRHNYEISYPYEWKCEKCSKIYGRYSKSIRPDECVCGVCKVGKLVPLFVKRKPATPKTAVVKPRDPLHSPVGSPTKKSYVTHQTSPPSAKLDNKDVLNLVNALSGISIDDARNA